MDSIVYPICRAHRPIIGAPEICFRFQICCSVSKLGQIKGEWVQILHFSSSVVISVIRGMSECIFCARLSTQQPLIYLWVGEIRSAVRESEIRYLVEIAQ